MLDLIHRYGGQITFDSLSELSVSKSLNQQVDLLKEDLLQANFENDQLIDIGWYPSFNLTGCFQIRLIKSFDWEIPFFLGKTADMNELKLILEEALLKLNK